MASAGSADGVGAWEGEMKFWKSAQAAPIGFVFGLFAMSADAAEILTLHATSGQFLLAGFYPAYVVFLKGLDPATIKTEWVDKAYKAVLDIKEGPEKVRAWWSSWYRRLQPVLTPSGAALKAGRNLPAAASPACRGPQPKTSCGSVSEHSTPTVCRPRSLAARWLNIQIFPGGARTRCSAPSTCTS